MVAEEAAEPMVIVPEPAVKQEQIIHHHLHHHLRRRHLFRIPHRQSQRQRRFELADEFFV